MKRHNNIPAAQILPPKIADHETILNITEPAENHKFLNDIQRDPAFKKVDFKKMRHCFSKKSLILEESV